jgi:tetraacyldisaccharide 4'-kinase
MLRIVSGLTGWIVALRRLAYQRGLFKVVLLPLPVVVIGNVVAGGAGKTPTVIAVVDHLRAKGWRVGVISRGHGRRTNACLAVRPDSSPEQVGDEPLLIAQRCGVPVMVAGKRVMAARAILADHPELDLVVSDDGLQHMALGRHVEVVVFDDRGIGNGRLLPAGWLREPWPRHADVVLHTGNKPAFTGPTARRALADVARNGRGETRALADLQAVAASGEAQIAALAAIARPEAFFDMLRGRGLPLALTLALPDHFDFQNWAVPPPWAQAPNLLLICTEKDAPKLWTTRPDAWAVGLVFEPEVAFFEALDRCLPTSPGHAPAFTDNAG